MCGFAIAAGVIVQIADRTASSSLAIHDLTKGIGEAKNTAAESGELMTAMTQSPHAIDQIMVKTNWGGRQRNRKKGARESRYP